MNNENMNNQSPKEGCGHIFQNSYNYITNKQIINRDECSKAA